VPALVKMVRLRGPCYIRGTRDLFEYTRSNFYRTLVDNSIETCSPLYTLISSHGRAVGVAGGDSGVPTVPWTWYG
jgi:hypothetical protein